MHVFGENMSNNVNMHGEKLKTAIISLYNIN